MVANAASGLSRWPAQKRPKVPSKDCAVSTFAADASLSILLIPKANVPRVKNDQAVVGLAAAVVVGLAAAVAGLSAAVVAAVARLRLNNDAHSTIVDDVALTTVRALRALVLAVAAAAVAVGATRTGIREDAARTIGTIDLSPNVFAVKPVHAFGPASARIGLPC